MTPFFSEIPLENQLHLNLLVTNTDSKEDFRRFAHQIDELSYCILFQYSKEEALEFYGYWINQLVKKTVNDILNNISMNIARESVKEAFNDI